jgi:type III secretion protein J
MQWGIGRQGRCLPVRRLIVRLTLVCACAVSLAACNVELYGNLDQQEANEMVASLLRHHILAERAAGKDGRFIVMVDERAFANAITILDEHGLPKPHFATLCDVFKKEGLVSSPVQERMQMICALNQELSHTISDIDGILSARVQVVLPENDPLRQQLIPAQASVEINYRAGMPIDEMTPRIRMLVANSVAGLLYDKVSVIPFPVEIGEKAVGADSDLTPFLGMWVHRDSLSRIAAAFYGLIAVIIALAAALGFIFWRRHQRPYPLSPALPAKTP